MRNYDFFACGLTGVCAKTSIEQQLPGNLFLRIHRSFIVSVTYADAFTAFYIEIGNRKLNIGRIYKEEVTRRFS